MSGGSGNDRKLKPAYLIMGSDEPKVERAAARLRQRVADDSGTDINIDVFDAGSTDAPTVLRAAGTLPFGEGIRLVMVYGIGQWHKADKDQLVTFLADPPPFCCLALVGSGLRKNEGLYKAVLEVGEVLVYDAPRQSELPAWVMEQAAARKLKLGSSEARRLVEVAGVDQRTILGELDKLAAYTGGGLVERSDIEEVCWISSEIKIWDLTDSLGARDRAATFRHLEELLADRNEPTAVFYTLSNHLRRLCGVTAARERGEDPRKAAADMGLKPYPARKISAQSGSFTADGLRQALEIFSELDADLKGRSDLRADLALERALASALDVM